MHPFDQIIDAPTADPLELEDPAVSRRTALGTALVAGLGAVATGELHAQQVTTQAIGEEGGGKRPVKPPVATTNAVGEEGGGDRPIATTKRKGEEGGGGTTKAVGEEGGHRPGGVPRHDEVLFSGDLHASYKHLMLMIQRNTNPQTVADFKQKLETLVRYENGRCARQLAGAQFGKREPLVTLMKISNMSKFPVPAALAKQNLKRYARHPQYKNAKAVFEGRKTQPDVEPPAASTPPSPPANLPKPTTLAFGEEGGGRR